MNVQTVRTASRSPWQNAFVDCVIGFVSGKPVAQRIPIEQDTER